MKNRIGIPVALFAIGCFLPLGFTLAEPPEFQPRVVIPRAFPAIKNPPIVSRAEAEEQLKDDELVLGVVVGDKARAYPINMLTGPRREIINDTLGDTPLAATW